MEDTLILQRQAKADALRAQGLTVYEQFEVTRGSAASC